ncbi:uncharacterized protein LOC135156213 [Lytechinus pictus]|uniref:uncharacterized protein LOC135156213 n=1 Tax=Lytechinus pictus TaxID=7653 RepID=UPI0030B9E6E3
MAAMTATREDATGSLRNLTCPMCLGIFTEATILTSCGHTFCRNCLKTYDLSHQDRNYMVCPLCQKNTNLSANRVDDLLANITVNKFVDDYRVKNGGANATTAQIRPKCTSCKLQPHAVSFCRTCNDHLCVECRYCHEHLSIFEGHEIVSMQDAIKLIKCSFHRLEKKDIFCEDCKIYICLKCLPDGHQCHKIQNRATFGEELQLEVDNLVKRCATKEPELQMNNQNVEDQHNEVTTAMQRLLNDVNNAYRIKSRKLKGYHQNLKTQIHTLEKRYGDALNGVKSNDLQKIEGIRSSIARIAQIDKDTLGNLETEYLSVHKFMCKDLDYLLKEGNGGTSAKAIKNKAQRNKFKPSGKTRITLGSISGFTDTTPGTAMTAKIKVKKEKGHSKKKRNVEKNKKTNQNGKEELKKKKNGENGLNVVGQIIIGSSKHISGAASMNKTDTTQRNISKPDDSTRRDLENITKHKGHTSITMEAPGKMLMSAGNIRKDTRSISESSDSSVAIKKCGKKRLKSADDNPFFDSGCINSREAARKRFKSGDDDRPNHRSISEAAGQAHSGTNTGQKALESRESPVVIVKNVPPLKRINSVDNHTRPGSESIVRSADHKYAAYATIAKISQNEGRSAHGPSLVFTAVTESTNHTSEISVAMKSQEKNSKPKTRMEAHSTNIPKPDGNVGLLGSISDSTHAKMAGAMTKKVQKKTLKLTNDTHLDSTSIQRSNYSFGAAITKEKDDRSFTSSPASMSSPGKTSAPVSKKKVKANISKPLSDIRLDRGAISGSNHTSRSVVRNTEGLRRCNSEDNSCLGPTGHKNCLAQKTQISKPADSRFPGNILRSNMSVAEIKKVDPQEKRFKIPRKPPNQDIHPVTTTGASLVSGESPATIGKKIPMLKRIKSVDNSILDSERISRCTDHSSAENISKKSQNKSTSEFDAHVDLMMLQGSTNYTTEMCTAEKTQGKRLKSDLGNISEAGGDTYSPTPTMKKKGQLEKVIKREYDNCFDPNPNSRTTVFHQLPGSISGSTDQKSTGAVKEKAGLQEIIKKLNRTGDTNLGAATAKKTQGTLSKSTDKSRDLGSSSVSTIHTSIATNAKRVEESRSKVASDTRLNIDSFPGSSRKLEVVGSIGLQGSMWGLAKYSDRSVAIRHGYANGIDIIDVAGEKYQYTARKCYDFVFQRDKSICMSVGNTEAHIYSPDGSKKATIRVKNNGNFIAVNKSPSDEILVTNNGYQVYIFDEAEFNLKHTIRTVQSRTRQVSATSSGLVVTSSCCYTKPSIVAVYDREGDAGKPLIAPNDIYLYVAIDENDRIYIASVDWKNSKMVIRLYDLDGLNLKERLEVGALDIPLCDYWCTLVSLSPDLLAFACPQKLYFIRVPL